MPTTQTADEFLAECFEWEYCGECHGDTEDHTVCVGPFGNWFARCNSEHVTNCKVCTEAVE